MRQRKVKHEAERLAALDRYAVSNGTEIKGTWNKLFPKEGPLFLELGCGRGHFLAAHAEAEPTANFIGCEGRSSIVLRAMELIDKKEIKNALFIPDFILRMEDYYEPGELSGVYLNFSDPWPKARHAKRRLTHRSYLLGYQKALCEGGFIEFKTDNQDLFDFTLEECAAIGFTISESTRDLHKTELPARLIQTQYEHRFRLLGKPICYCRILCGK
ncbi:MAG: tRNA (guanosine(46)-N7)-methyltransferase TrmB [Eubacteriales bacterium]|nr:tRNA (guanosine(46)-N7)-methyltransferase TrmB [Eubacteriales bacterium]